jgi:hypothetical protein
MGETAGWERPNWYAPPGVEPEYRYSWGRQNWFEHTAAECRAVRDAVALFDQSSFAKFLVEGRDACAVLNRLSAAEVDVAADGQPKKKRTRRGTRGGRGRKKPATAAATTDGESEPESSADGADGRRRPRIHVPPPELAAAPAEVVAAAVELQQDAEVVEGATPSEVAADGQPKRKRSRRGSRGGKKRRKPATNGDLEPDAVETVGDDAAAPEYVPMSEWIEDFGSTKPPA